MTTALVRLPDHFCRSARESLHIAHSVLSLDVGGLERVVLSLIKECRRRGHRTSVVCVERRGQLAEQAESLGARVVSLDKPPGRSAGAIDQAAAALDELAPDVVHTHQIGALWYLGQAARKNGRVPLLHTEHTDHVAHARGWLAKLRALCLWRKLAPLSERFCCVSEDIARSVQRWRTVPRAKVDVVYNGIDLAAHDRCTSPSQVRSSLGIPPGALVIGTVGRLAEVKRQDLLIRAFAALRAGGRHPHTRLLIVGDGPERHRLEGLAQSLGIGNETIFAGYQPQPEKFLKAMDLFVLTSRHEGLPLALLEAWACSLAVVCSAVGAIPDTVAHGVSGLLFKSEDLAGLTQSLEQLLDAPWVIHQLGQRGQARVQHRYSLVRMADEYESRYRALISK